MVCLGVSFGLLLFCCLSVGVGCCVWVCIGCAWFWLVGFAWLGVPVLVGFNSFNDLQTQRTPKARAKEKGPGVVFASFRGNTSRGLCLFIFLSSV